MRRGWKAVLGIAVSGLLIWWVLRDVDPRQVWAEVRGANLWLLLLAVAITTSGFLIRALRWGVFLHPVRSGTRLHSRFAAVNIGFGLNNVLPARMGEFARAWSFARLESVTVSATFGSIVVERFMDLLAVFGLLLVAVLHPSFPGSVTVGGRSFESLLPGVAVVLVLTVSVLLVPLLLPNTLVSLARRVAPHLPGRAGHLITEFLEAFLRGLGALRSPRLLSLSVIWSFAFWAWNGLSYLVGLWAFGIEQGYVTALFVQAIITLGVAVPAAPGYVGTFQAAAVIALHEVYGVAEGPTLAFAFGYHLGSFLPVTLLGLWYAARVGLSVSDLRRTEGIGLSGTREPRGR